MLDACNRTEMFLNSLFQTMFKKSFSMLVKRTIGTNFSIPIQRKKGIDIKKKQQNFCYWLTTVIEVKWSKFFKI